MLANLAQPEMDFQSLPYGDGFSRFQDQYADETYDDSSPLHFTGKERDAESGNDYFLARYYSSAIGRFMSPDWSSKEEPVPYARLGDPQSLNLYAYLGNDPLGSVDLDGHTSELDAATQRYALRIGVRTFDQIAAAQGKAQQLTFERFPVASRDVFIKWKLKWPTPSGGEIIQRVTGMMVTFQDNHAVKTPYNYWEAWRVDPGKTQVNDAKFDDQTGGLAGTHLSLRARFYPGLTNDELTHKYGFTIGGGPGAASLLSTTKDPQLPTGSATAPVDRTVTFK
jgi:RHS repeat-associated protein